MADSDMKNHRATIRERSDQYSSYEEKRVGRYHVSLRWISNRTCCGIQSKKEMRVHYYLQTCDWHCTLHDPAINLIPFRLHSDTDTTLPIRRLSCYSISNPGYKCLHMDGHDLSLVQYWTLLMFELTNHIPEVVKVDVMVSCLVMYGLRMFYLTWASPMPKGVPGYIQPLTCLGNYSGDPTIH